jgi:EAL domain-containing protein (putative c-di-GMP-specific phosphodiesterase class I)
LKECVRKSDTVARLGGDEFVVVLPNINSFDNLIWVAQNIIDAMNDPFYLEDKKFLVTASLGIALYPDDGKSGQTVMKNADAAMYASKESGKNTFRFFKESMLDKSIYKLFRASEIREAIERGEFILHFQPRFWTGTRKIHSAEALVRWEHPERGLIYPGDFIPLAEETGLITRIDRWVLQEACSKNRELQEATGRSLVFSINLSAKDFAQHNLIDIINRCIMDSGIAPALLEVEITETVIMEDVQRSIKTLERLKETGVTISVDDFGTGYSSLSYLKMFPIDLLKIDRSFVTGLPDDRNDMAVVEAIIAMGHALGMSVLAEGVETSEQFDFLARKGCDFMQGYYFARPVPFDVLEKMLLAEYSA